MILNLEGAIASFFRQRKHRHHLFRRCLDPPYKTPLPCSSPAIEPHGAPKTHSDDTQTLWSITTGLTPRHTTGSAQGGVISPLLANVYLHYVLDVWWEEVVKPRVVVRAFLIRYADDLVIGFTDESDARRVMEALPKRFGEYGLALHPDKTQLVPFASCH